MLFRSSEPHIESVVVRSGRDYDALDMRLTQGDRCAVAEEEHLPSNRLYFQASIGRSGYVNRIE